MNNTIRIHISGPHGDFDGALEVIKQALIKAGAKVTVVDEYPSLVLPHNLDLKREKITITTSHGCWGG